LRIGVLVLVGVEDLHEERRLGDEENAVQEHGHDENSVQAASLLRMRPFS